jgi:hypothetical protein
LRYREHDLGDTESVRSILAITVAATTIAAPPAQLVTSNGRIGDLQVDVSRRAQIVAMIGQPGAERVGTWSGSGRYRALGYGCSPGPTSVTWPLLAGGPYCRTVFFLGARDGRLRNFYTSSSRYQAEKGVRIGMSTAGAQRLLHRRVFVGCESNVYIGSLTIAFDGGQRAADGHLVGGHVYAFVLHSRSHDLGLFDCL